MLRYLSEVQYLDPAPDAPAPTETAVIAAVPAAEPLVSVHRQQLDPAASWGVPAHVTVLYPFVAPEAITDDLITTLGAAVRPVNAFDCRFVRTRWFDRNVLWLDPEPAQPFRQLTAAVWRAFPQYPPFGGAYADLIPHLTVAQQRVADLPTLLAVERTVQSGLPLTARIESLLLIAGAPALNSWRVVNELRLEPPPDVPG
jgi:2'-5' RNA ligase